MGTRVYMKLLPTDNGVRSMNYATFKIWLPNALFHSVIYVNAC